MSSVTVQTVTEVQSGLFEHTERENVFFRWLEYEMWMLARPSSLQIAEFGQKLAWVSSLVTVNLSFRTYEVMHILAPKKYTTRIDTNQAVYIRERCFIKSKDEANRLNIGPSTPL